MTLLEALAKKSEAPIEIISGVAVGRKFRWHRGHIQTQTATSEFWNDCTNISALILAWADKVKIKGNDMVEKLDIDYDSPCRLRQEYGQKINEIIDDLHELKALYKEYDKSLAATIESINVHERQIDELQMKLEPHKCESRPENVLTKTLRMDKEFAEDECVRLQDELGRTRKALDVAVDALKEYADRDNWGMGFAPWLEDGFKDALYTEDGYKTAEKALEQITALEQKDVK